MIRIPINQPTIMECHKGQPDHLLQVSSETSSLKMVAPEEDEWRRLCRVVGHAVLWLASRGSASMATNWCCFAGRFRCGFFVHPVHPPLGEWYRPWWKSCLDNPQLVPMKQGIFMLPGDDERLDVKERTEIIMFIVQGEVHTRLSQHMGCQHINFWGLHIW